MPALPTESRTYHSQMAREVRFLFLSSSSFFKLSYGVPKKRNAHPIVSEYNFQSIKNKATKVAYAPSHFLSSLASVSTISAEFPVTTGNALASGFPFLHTFALTVMMPALSEYVPWSR